MAGTAGRTVRELSNEWKVRPALTGQGFRGEVSKLSNVSNARIETAVIYFIQAEGVGHIKIGFTDAEGASARLVSLQIGSPVLLKLLGVIPGTVEDEKNLHRRFAAHRVTGEWFRPVPELLALVPGDPPKSCGGVEIVERHVSIRALTVGRKQFTKALLDQLPSRKCIDWVSAATHVLKGLSPDCDLGKAAAVVDLDDFIEGDVWGWVTGGFISEEDGPPHGRWCWVIHEFEGLLCRHKEFESRNYRAQAAYSRDDMKRALVLAEELHGRREFKAEWGPTGQLFIGV